MKLKFDIELNPLERITYSFNTRESGEVIDRSMKNTIHEKVDKLLEVFSEND